jgi:hypothetical protein
MSPLGPPRTPRPPWPLRRILPPLSVPPGTVMSSFLELRTEPAPLQAVHFSVGTLPRPTQAGQGRTCAKPPRPKLISPRPPHSVQACNLAPLAAPFPPQVPHSSFTSRVIGTLPPSAATLNGTSSVVSTLWPFSGPLGRCCRPPPKIEPKRSPKPPSPPMSNSSIRGPPCDEPPGRAPPLRGPRAVNGSKAPRRRISSYCFRFSASPRTLCASEISLKRSAALASPGLVSG